MLIYYVTGRPNVPFLVADFADWVWCGHRLECYFLRLILNLVDSFCTGRGKINSSALFTLKVDNRHVISDFTSMWDDEVLASLCVIFSLPGTV